MFVYVGENSKFNSHVSDFIFRLLRKIAAAATERGYRVL
jgi:hypothetical protein